MDDPRTTKAVSIWEKLSLLHGVIALEFGLSINYLVPDICYLFEIGHQGVTTLNAIYLVRSLRR